MDGDRVDLVANLQVGDVPRLLDDLVRTPVEVRKWSSSRTIIPDKHELAVRR